MAVVIRPYTLGQLGVSQDSDALTLPAGTTQWQVGIVVMPGMFAVEDLCIRMSSAYKQVPGGSVIGGGFASLFASVSGGSPGGQAGEEPGIVPVETMTNFTMDWRDSAYFQVSGVNAPNGSDTIAIADVFPVVRTVVCGGSPLGVSFAIVCEAYDIAGNILTW